MMFAINIDAATITCPKLSCTVALDTNQCYLHDNVQPTISLRGQSCTSKRIWEFSTSDGEFAWYSETAQESSSGTSSFIQDKEMQGFWHEISATRQNLLPGRNCDNYYECYSGKCSGGQCSGLSEGDYCANNQDCGANMFCKKQPVWPFRSKCNDLLGNMEICTNDFECGARYFCWYATVAEKTSGLKRCLDKFSAADEQIFGYAAAPTGSSLTNEEYNGQFWESGLAVNTATDTSTCKSVTSITYNGVTVASPYAWTATDTSIKCNLVYGTGASDYIETPCVCALDGTNGYWGSIVGTDEFQKYTAAMKTVLESVKCHTLDREDLRAYREKWGIGTSKDEWRYAIEKRFNVTYWAWIQPETTRNCINAIFADSYTNLYKTSAMNWIILLPILSSFLIMAI